MRQVMVAGNSDSETKDQKNEGNQAVPSNTLEKFCRTEESMRSMLVHPFRSTDQSFYPTVTTSLGWPISWLSITARAV